MIDFGIHNVFTAIGVARDLAYDGVFHIGDTTMDFMYDIASGGSHNSSYRTGYMNRQLDRRERRSTDKPLKLEERKIYEQIFQRQQHEPLIDYWKRRKALMAYPDKHELIDQYRSIELQKLQLNTQNQRGELDKQKSKLDDQFREIMRVKLAQASADAEKSLKSNQDHAVERQLQSGKRLTSGERKKKQEQLVSEFKKTSQSKTKNRQGQKMR